MPKLLKISYKVIWLKFHINIGLLLLKEMFSIIFF